MLLSPNRIFNTHDGKVRSYPSKPGKFIQTASHLKGFAGSCGSPLISSFVTIIPCTAWYGDSLHPLLLSTKLPTLRFRTHVLFLRTWWGPCLTKLWGRCRVQSLRTSHQCPSGPYMFLLWQLVEGTWESGNPNAYTESTNQSSVWCHTDPWAQQERTSMTKQILEWSCSAIFQPC